ncbi:type II toxin-antitoxin system HicB family antitoxin [Pasteurella multocida]|uniref:type II toxin-antitoxin system HicB family antitoxin n=1 Tax=Pasteurella multocida TaxID=747 RepID=UPI000BBD1B58|nr:type II toxin-antitoxin system HicB family antitoxin [Pasteurella multocida]ATF73911.1 CopG family transcriptional regulator [Pasteurella multocida]ATN16313.1 CopG family transcriptional regulator [Pasteurella multocida]HDR1207038.1 type II toxin-antitoxin system HicB family antitoxin [Pasteurella multocida]HDR1386032.1 type II toxin-antitoxin system HicB family antitoxin [Pasteurella multocida]HDR1925710.1 type II toxin-antitoxin system HicB family antitoxin [Pasteurella multocida]
MLFTIGVETPKKESEAFGLCVPALFNETYSCFSAADTVEKIIPAVTDAIYTILETMVENNFDISQIKDLGFMHYKQQKDFEFCDSWLLIDVDITAYFGKRQRVNVVLPQYLIDRIDQRVANNPTYKDRSHFLTIASQRELSSSL